MFIKKIFKLLIFFITIFSISACNNDNGELQPNQLLSTSVENQVPVSSSYQLKNTDDDNNGIRDDIDELIKQRFSYKLEVKAAAEQEARSLQQFIEANSKEEALLAAEQIARATSCTFKIFSDPINDYVKRQALSTEIETWTTNTPARLAKYLQVSKLISGAYFTQAVEPVCD